MGVTGCHTLTQRRSISHESRRLIADSHTTEKGRKKGEIVKQMT